MASSISVVEFAKAVATLNEALDFAAQAKDKTIHFKIARDACIHRFKYCIELAWKTAVKKLGSQTKFPKPAIREMARANLIDSAEMWLDFIEARNNSGHSYDENVARKVFEQIQKFAIQADDLLARLEKIP